MKNKFIISTGLCFGFLFAFIVTISLYQFDVIKIKSRQNIESVEADASNADIAHESGATENSTPSKIISFFSFFLNFSK
jgi:hypothetical protein